MAKMAYSEKETESVAAMEPVRVAKESSSSHPEERIYREPTRRRQTNDPIERSTTETHCIMHDNIKMCVYVFGD